MYLLRLPVSAVQRLWAIWQGYPAETRDHALVAVLWAVFWAFVIALLCI